MHYLENRFQCGSWLTATLKSVFLSLWLQTDEMHRLMAPINVEFNWSAVAVYPFANSSQISHSFSFIYQMLCRETDRNESQTMGMKILTNENSFRFYLNFFGFPPKYSLSLWIQFEK